MTVENNNIKIIENNTNKYENKHENKHQQKEEEECIKDLNSLIEIQKDINSLLLVQQEKIDNVEKNIANSENNIEVGKEEIKKSHKMYWKVSGPIGAGITGGIIAGPVGFYAGVKGAMLLGTTAGASVVSGFGAKIYNKVKRKE